MHGKGSKANRLLSRNTTENSTSVEGKVGKDEWIETTACCNLNKLWESDVYNKPLKLWWAYVNYKRWRCTVNWILRCYWLYLFSPVTRHPSLSPVNLNQGGRKCELRERGVVKSNHDVLHTISVPPSCEESGRFPSPFLFNPTPLPPTPSQTGWTGRQCREGRPLGPHPAPPPLHTRPHSGSSLPPIWRGRQLFFNPPPPVVGGTQHDLACFQFLSSLFFSFSFFFSFEYAGWCCLHLRGQQLLTKTLTLE